MSVHQHTQATLPQRRKSTVLLWLFIGLIAAGLFLCIIRLTVLASMSSFGYLIGIGAGCLLVGVIGTVITALARSGDTDTPPPSPAAPIGHTPDGRPIYPVVGYTPDGQPVTADRAIGYRPTNPRTNSLAVVALILGFAFPLLAIPVGIVARSQIRRTGEQGEGLALAGLILGYLSLFAVLALVVLIAAQTR
jgi:hypothetical protein